MLHSLFKLTLPIQSNTYVILKVSKIKSVWGFQKKPSVSTFILYNYYSHFPLLYIDQFSGTTLGW